MKPIDEVDVEGARRSVHGFGSRCPSAGRMGGKIVRAEIGLGFRNRKGDTFAADPAHQRPSEQVTRDDIGRPFKEGRTEKAQVLVSMGIRSRPGAFRVFAVHLEIASNEQRAERVIKLAQERHMKLATVESCTARSLAHLLSQTESATDTLHGGFIVYTKENKTAAVGVPKELLGKDTT